MIILPNKSIKVLQKFFAENKQLINKYMFVRVADAINQNKKVATLFHTENKKYMFWIPEEYYEQTLDHIFDVCVAGENYELAKKVDVFIKQYYINKLLRDVTVK